ncbi:ankyrin repeat-containing domain protein [Cladorrhinum samala]|uniref:Ankyrin repeat-containing domain protein n=1 Tax=Cladorrhinum samala TaxID=585594 RepID=A0AAV9I5I6_9PEZI|nr:ankyrin repeat-containing domain protein [Cladorrhinum samala]
MKPATARFRLEKTGERPLSSFRESPVNSKVGALQLPGPGPQRGASDSGGICSFPAENTTSATMRLLDTSTLELVTFVGHETPLYAILSHRWEADEVSLQDMIERTAARKAGYAKVLKACSIAASHGLKYIWIDTCCIDKISSAELSEAINSMYRWYQESAICYAFLSDVELNQSAGQDASLDARYPTFRETCWLTRGWTLQELIAPSVVIFLDSAWKEIGTKTSLSKLLSDLTRIPQAVLVGDASPLTTSSAQRFSWASRRKTTRPEDIAYCLMGLFNVNMPILYGEGGQRAFVRLQEQIIKVSDDHTIFAWEWPTSRCGFSRAPNGGLLASHPSAFDSCQDMTMWDLGSTRNTLSYVISTSNKGIHLKVNFIPGKHWKDVHIAVLPCQRTANRAEWVGIPLRSMSSELEYFTRAESHPLIVQPLNVFEFEYRPADICIRHGSQSDRKQPAIVKAIESGDVSLAQMLLFLEVKHGSMKYAEKALLAAADAGYSSVVEFLVASGANIETTNATGCTPLLLAAIAGHASVVDSLIDRGALVNARNRDGQTALMAAAEEGHDSVIRVLLSKGADLEAFDRTGMTPLLWAVVAEHLEAARILVLAGANVNVRTRHGSSALMCAAGSRHSEMCQLLIDNGADIDARDEDGHNALHVAVDMGYMDVASMIMNASNRRR